MLLEHSCVNSNFIIDFFLAYLLSQPAKNLVTFIAHMLYSLHIIIHIFSSFHIYVLSQFSNILVLLTSCDGVIPRQRGYLTIKELIHNKEVIPRYRSYSTSTAKELFHDKEVIPRQRSFSTTRKLFHGKGVIPRQGSYSTTRKLFHGKGVIPRQGSYSTAKELFHDKKVIPRQRSNSTTNE